MKKINPFKLALILIPVVIGMSAITVNNDKYFEIVKNIEIFTNIYKEINTHYVDEIDPSQLMRTGIDAMLKSLDPYTNYISESQIENYRLNTEGKYNGMGALSGDIDGKVTIMEIYEGGSAASSGLKVGDVISVVNNQSVEGKTNDEVIQIMRGAQGGSLNMKVKRAGSAAPIAITMDRTNVEIPNVPYSGMVGDHMGYVILTTFTQRAGKNVEKAVKKLKKEDPELAGVILDLRGNRGGLLFEALNVCNVFIPNGEEIVFTRGKIKEQDKTYKTSNAPIDLNIPLAVLVNKTSASASEIVSGVVQDLDRGVIIGQRSYGKGLVQNTKELGYNSRVKVTTSKYYIPSGRCIQGVNYNAEGEPVDIEDSKRATYYTKNKRPVLDGGGVTPDVKYELKDDIPVIKTLKEEHYIFKYVNNFVSDKDSIEAPGTFKFADYQGFKAFLKANDFSFTTEAEEHIQKIKEGHSATALNAEISAMEQKIASQKQDDLDQYQAEIVRAIEAEIIARFNYEKGKAIQGLSTDPEIKLAKEILNNSERYNSILKG